MDQYPYKTSFIERQLDLLCYIYGVECWPTKRRHIQQLNVVVMRMLCWICAHTRMDKVWNDDIRDHLGVAPN